MKRAPYIDIVKGLSIWCIVLLHYENGVFPNSLNVFIGSFMITAFFVSSGWVSAMRPSQRTLKELAAKRWRQLGLPYVWWSGIILAFDLLLYAFGYYSPYFLESEAYKAIILRGIGTLWFLPALFGGELIWHGLRRCHWRSVALAFLGTILYMHVYGLIFGGQTEAIYKIIAAPFRTLSNILMAWTGIAFGYYAYTILGRRIEHAHPASLLLSGLFLCTVAWFCTNSWPSSIGILWLYTAPLLGPLGLLLMAKALQSWRPLSFFDYWGRHSLNLMLTHYSITLVICNIIVQKCMLIPFSGRITLICFFCSIPIQYFWVFFVNKYAPFTLGRV